MKAKIEREQVVQLFLHNDTLTFASIEKQINIRSNKLAYILETLVKEGVLQKHNRQYMLTQAAEKSVPYVSDMQSALPVILVAGVCDGKVVYHQRSKRPFKGLFSLAGGRLLLNESIPQAAQRILEKNTGMRGQFSKVNHVMHEIVDSMHSFVLIFVTVQVQDKTIRPQFKDNVTWLSNPDQETTIPSDYMLVTQYLDKAIQISHLTQTKEYALKSHNFL